MPDISFACPHCDQHLEAPEDMAGTEIACPACSGVITVPTPPEKKKWNLPGKKTAGKGGDGGESGAAQNKCPDCGAAINAGAVICIKCGLDLRTGKKIDTKLG